MIVASTYSRAFHSDKLTKRKYQMLHEQALSLRAVRNELSILVNKDPIRYLEVSKISFQKEMLPLIKDRVHSNFTKQICDDVLTSYQNRFAAIKKRMIFEKVRSLEMTFYKRNTRDSKKGDPRCIIRKTESTALTKTLSYLARYGAKGTLSYLEAKILDTSTELSKRKFFAQVIEHCERLGFERLMLLAMSKRASILKRYEHPIEYESLSFRARSRLSTEIVSYNRNFQSVVKAFVNVSWTTTRSSLKIPVLYSNSFHGAKKRYSNGTDTSYTVCFDEAIKSVRVVLSHEGERDLPDASKEDVFVGFDANSKHNQLTGSNGLSVDHDRESLRSLIVELLKTDELKSRQEGYEPGRKRSKKIGTLRRKILHHTERNCAYLCKQMVLNRENHAVFEDLDNSFGRSFVKTKDDLNYNRLVKEMHLSSVKDEFEHIARKYRIGTSTVHAEYTSQQCSVCGYIDEGNRKSQESFVCLECGHTDNADHNASENIRKRASEAVPRGMLLVASKLGNGNYSPKALPRWRVKELLLSLRCKPPKEVRDFGNLYA